MRYTRRVTSTRDVVDRTTCDLCGDAIVEAAYVINETTIERRLGTGYPEGGDVETVSVDMCVLCFDTKLVPWLKSQGATPLITEFDF